MSLSDRRQLFVAAAFLPLLLLAFDPEGARAQTPSVNVELEGRQLAVHVLEPSDLAAVLETVCGRVQARCDDLSAAVGITVQPITVTGTWRVVLRQLMEGTGLNYIALAPADQQPARLLISQRPAGVPDSAVAAATVGKAQHSGDDRSAVDGEDSSVAGRAVGADRERWERERQERERSTAVPERAGSAGAGGRSGLAQPSPEPERPTVIAGPSAPFVPPPGTVATPFLGPDGNPIVMPVLPPGQSGSPFPEFPGTPPGQPVGSPFLGPDGKPIPITPPKPGQVPNPFLPDPQPK